MPQSVATFLMFNDGNAEEALNAYLQIFPGSSVQLLVRWGSGEAPEGKIKRAHATIAGHHLMFFDSPMKHAFTFTPAISLFVECATEAELDETYAKLADGGQPLMPLGSYGSVGNSAGSTIALAFPGN